MDENNNVTNDEVKVDKVSNVENNEVKTDVVNVDASVLTNEEIKNISEDVITTPQENVELPELPKIEPEVVTPNNTSKPVTKNKPKKKKHPIKIIINIFIIYLKGFIIGFTLSSFFLVYKYKGLLAALIYVFPTSIINILVCLLLGVYSVLFTINLWKIIFLKEKNYNMKKFIKKYFLLLILCIILILISSLTEGFLVPSLLKLVIKLFI